MAKSVFPPRREYTFSNLIIEKVYSRLGGGYFYISLSVPKCTQTYAGAVFYSIIQTININMNMNININININPNINSKINININI